MKRILGVSIVICVFALNISGCLKRVSIATIEKELVDQDAELGNRGYIAGNKPPIEKTEKKQKTRKIYQVTLQIPPYAEWKNFRNKPTEDKELWGNRGYVYGGPESEYTQEQKSEEAPSIILPEEVNEEADVTMPLEPVKAAKPMEKEVSFTTYKVQKGDTLQKISTKVYGTTKKWQKIFEFNKSTLKNPNKIYPGQKILIPQD